MEFIKFLTSKSINDIDETIEFEEKFKILLPPIYKCFMQTFVINRKCITLPSYFDLRYGTDYQFTIQTYQKNDMLAFDTFFSLMETIELKKRMYIDEDEEIFREYLPIGNCGMNIILLVGIGVENKDKIFIEVDFLEERMIMVANNIFDFLKSFSVTIDEFGLQHSNIDLNKMYLKFGESVWRLMD